MSPSKYAEILSQYKYREGYATFKTHDGWFAEHIVNGVLKLLLKNTLVEIKATKDLRKYDFVLLTIQVMPVDFSEEDDHFELLFEIADVITEKFEVSQKEDKEPWLLHQLADICIHNSDQVKLIEKRNPGLISSVVAKIGKVKYQPESYGPQMYFAAYKAIGLFWDMPKERAKEIIQEVYLKHFDGRVVEETEALIEHLKEDGSWQ
ncbi:MAG: hypothetical protein AAFN81_31440 [Bacteroidota bacterium]